MTAPSPAAPPPAAEEAGNVVVLPTVLVRGQAYADHYATCRTPACGSCEHLSTRLIAAVNEEIEEEERP